jgi:circadian clock protein KaiC
MSSDKENNHIGDFPKSPTGINGLDEITDGGLPKGRPTLVYGGPGCGKTLLAMEFLVRGAQEFNEPGVFISFEELEKDLCQNVNSLGWNVKEMIDQEKLLIDYVQIEKSEIEETGEFDLEALFIRIAHAVDSVGAKRIAIDTLESLFGVFDSTTILRAELRRLFLFLKEKGLTAVITAELDEKGHTRHGMEDYVSDCVIFMDHRMKEQAATRRIRVVKYRGSAHGTNEYPFLIGDQGISVLPITSFKLDYKVSKERVQTGIPRLDTMLGGEGFYEGSSVLLSGTSGSGKSTVCASFANATCQRGERCLYFSFEESQDQIIRNMGSVGMKLNQWVEKGLLQFYNIRSTTYGLEMHLVKLHNLIDKFEPQVVIIDPISNLMVLEDPKPVKSMITRLIDYLKINNITSMFSDLSHGFVDLESTQAEISSLMDTWLLLRDVESSGERNRIMYVLKSRGMAHSNQLREFVITNNGIELNDAYIGPAGVLTGTARFSQEAKEKADKIIRAQEISAFERRIEEKRKIAEAKIDALKSSLVAEEEEIKKKINEAKLREEVLLSNGEKRSQMRGSD